jgi:hypothetical protein
MRTDRLRPRAGFRCPTLREGGAVRTQSPLPLRRVGAPRGSVAGTGEGPAINDWGPVSTERWPYEGAAVCTHAPLGPLASIAQRALCEVAAGAGSGRGDCARTTQICRGKSDCLDRRHDPAFSWPTQRGPAVRAQTQPRPQPRRTPHHGVAACIAGKQWRSTGALRGTNDKARASPCGWRSTTTGGGPPRHTELAPSATKPARHRALRLAHVQEKEEEGGLYCRSATRPRNNTTRWRTKREKKALPITLVSHPQETTKRTPHSHFAANSDQ